MTPTAIATPEMRGLQTPVNSTPAGFDPSRDFPRGFMDFFRPLHERLTPRLPESARAHARDMPSPRDPGDRRDDGALPQP